MVLGVGLMKHGGPDVLQVLELKEADAGDFQIRVRVHAAAINPTDIVARNGQIAARQRGFAPPYVPAMDITGTIDQIDPNINRNLKKKPQVFKSSCLHAAKQSFLKFFWLDCLHHDIE